MKLKDMKIGTKILSTISIILVLMIVSAVCGIRKMSNIGNELTAIAKEDMPLIEVAFLNGQQQPTIESARADFDTLGIDLRGFFDFGVDWIDYRGGVKSKGAA